MRKGYLGPLGDDFPALFPLLLGLALFFSSIIITYQVYDHKTAMTAVTRANVMIGKSTRQQIVMDDAYWEDEVCSSLNNTQANYGVHAAIKIVRSEYDDYDPSGTSTFTTQDPVRLGGKDMTCPMDADWDDYVPSQGEEAGRLMMRMVYPVIIKQGNERVMGSLMVVTWK